MKDTIKAFLGLTLLLLGIAFPITLACDTHVQPDQQAFRMAPECPEGCVCECVDPTATGSSSSSAGLESASSSSDAGSSSSDSSGSTGTAADPLAYLSDDFSGDLSAWTVYRPQDAAQLSVSGGQLTLAPNPGTSWYNAGESVQLGQQVTGDFQVTATMSVTSGPQPWQLVGISMRADGVFPPDTYHAVLGTIGGQSELQAEWKTTDDGNSLWAAVPNPSGVATVTLCRVGSDLRSMYNGVVLHEVTRPDLAGPVMVGPMAYSVTGTADIVGTFDAVDFASLADMESCGD